ncbi:MAG: hypothetical protein ACKVIR_07090 [Candidatus Poseidoniales archaeon]
MRGHILFTILLALMIITPVTGNTSVSAAEEEEPTDQCEVDPLQPCENRTTLYIWSTGQSNQWAHFNESEERNSQGNQLQNEKENGLINIDYSFNMKPSLLPKLNMTPDGEVRFTFNIFLQGDWTNGDNDGPCQADCDELNISLFSGAKEIVRQHIPAVTTGWNSIIFTHILEENELFWDSSIGNPTIGIEMKVKGDYQEPTPITFTGEIANFSMKLSGDQSAKIELPIDPSTWSAEFQAEEDLNPPVEQPGFLALMSVGALTMAAVYMPMSRKNSQDE